MSALLSSHCFSIVLLSYRYKDERCKGQIKVVWLHDHGVRMMMIARTVALFKCTSPRCWKISTCHAPSQVLSAEIVEADRCFRRHLGGSAAGAEGHHGNCYLLVVCLISHNSVWLRYTH